MLCGRWRKEAPEVQVLELPGLARVLKAGPCVVGVGEWGGWGKVVA